MEELQKVIGNHRTHNKPFGSCEEELLTSQLESHHQWARCGFLEVCKTEEVADTLNFGPRGNVDIIIHDQL